MENSCMRCGRCCTQFAVCVTPSDVSRISKETGLQPEEFLDLIPEPPDRERKESSILINGKRCLLVLKREIDNKCFFYSKSGCTAYINRPMLCRSYPFRVFSPGSWVLDEMKSRACIESWTPNEEEKQRYLDDCKEYEEQIEKYRILADQWNKRGGSFSEFLSFVTSFPWP
jgi:Fe-S-cluster containining protein